MGFKTIWICGMLLIAIGGIAERILLTRVWRISPDWARQEGFPSSWCARWPRGMWAYSKARWRRDQHFRDRQLKMLLAWSLIGDLVLLGMALFAILDFGILHWY